MRKYFIKRNITNLLKRYPNKIMLNVGCGTDYKDGWINIDNNSDHNIVKLDLNWDLRNPLPFEDNTIDYIYNEHFMEHLTVEEAKSSIEDFMRVLKKGGVLRIAMPNLEDVVKNYLNKKWKKELFLKKYGLDFIKTPAELMNINFTWWGHKWLYDWTELERRLNDSGYKKIKRCENGKSTYDNLKNLETRPESTLIAEVTK